MRVGIDARLVVKGRGLGEFAYQLISHLPEDEDIEYIVYSYNNFTWDKAVLPKKTKIVIVPSSYVISEQIWLPWLIRRDKLDVFHATTNTAPMWLPSRLKLVLTIHDAMFLTDKLRIPISTSLYQRLGRKYYAKMAKIMLHRANQLVTISHFSQADLAEGFGIDSKQLQVIYEGVGNEFKQIEVSEVAAVKQKFEITHDYWLHLGAVDPRKQTKQVIMAYHQLVEKGLVDRQLVISGLSLSQAEPFKSLVASFHLDDRVVFVGFVTKPELVALMNGAQLFLFPSLYEGFGLPMVQAMACGCSVIAAQTSSLPEIGGKAAMYVNLDQPEDLALKIEELANNASLRGAYVKRGLARAAEFNWDTTSLAYTQLYKKVL